MATLTPIIPEYKPISIAHAVVTEGGKTLRMSGWPAVGPNGIIGRGDMRAQTLQAMDYVRQTVEAAGAISSIRTTAGQHEFSDRRFGVVERLRVARAHRAPRFCYARK
jgi:hypothetical protein